MERGKREHMELSVKTLGDRLRVRLVWKTEEGEKVLDSTGRWGVGDWK